MGLMELPRKEENNPYFYTFSLFTCRKVCCKVYSCKILMWRRKSLLLHLSGWCQHPQQVCRLHPQRPPCVLSPSNNMRNGQQSQFYQRIKTWCFVCIVWICVWRKAMIEKCFQSQLKFGFNIEVAVAVRKSKFNMLVVAQNSM